MDHVHPRGNVWTHSPVHSIVNPLAHYFKVSGPPRPPVNALIYRIFITFGHITKNIM